MSSKSQSASPPEPSKTELIFTIINEDDFNERVLKNQLLVLVDFYADWCGPCKVLGPRLEKAVKKQEGRVAMAKVDVDKHTELTNKYRVSVIPMVIAMRGGDVVGQFVRSKDDDDLDSFISGIIEQ